MYYHLLRKGFRRSTAKIILSVALALGICGVIVSVVTVRTETWPETAENVYVLVLVIVVPSCR